MTMTRGWEELKSDFPHLAHTWGYLWRESELKRQELREDMVRRRWNLERQEENVKWLGGKMSEVKKWLREGGEWGRGGDVL